MTAEEKQQYYIEAKTLLDNKRQKIHDEIQEIPFRLTQLKELKDGSTAGELAYLTFAQASRKRFDELQNLYPSPYFNRMQIQLAGEAVPREIFVGKFSFSEAEIYSWTSPIAVARFEAPGQFCFNVGDDKQQGKIFLKDQYLINDGKILFLAAEKLGQERELIFQEYFSQRKTDFVLPEIVAQMEKAQDAVIRAQVEGPLVISGPAGSGKTTLALHRVAYLLQSPDTADLYSQDKIIVFVQDVATKNYFSGLLPSFGINDVTLTTFGEWALEILDLADLNFANRFLADEQAANDYEVAKIKALRSGKLPILNPADPYGTLAYFYQLFFNAEQKKYFAGQKIDQLLDRFDLTLLLAAQAQMEPLKIKREYYQVASDRSLTRKIKQDLASYSLIVLDEFENYLPEQIRLIKGVLDQQHSSILYVGDLKQQIYLGATKQWQDLGREFVDYDRLPAERQLRIIRLAKVYRNTKEILNYISGLGYQVEIPESLRSGKPVEEVGGITKEQELDWVKNKVAQLPEVSIGILAKDKSHLTVYQEAFIDRSNIKVMPMTEAQGVEFDVVFLLNLDGKILANDHGSLEGENQEFWRIDRDLLYIALTRAMNELYVSVRR